jgi:hypothetical protein
MHFLEQQAKDVVSKLSDEVKGRLVDTKFKSVAFAKSVLPCLFEPQNEGKCIVVEGQTQHLSVCVSVYIQHTIPENRNLCDTVLNKYTREHVEI